MLKPIPTPDDAQGDQTASRRLDAAAKTEPGDLVLYRAKDGRRFLRVWEGDAQSVDAGAVARWYEIVPTPNRLTTR